MRDLKSIGYLAYGAVPKNSKFKNFRDYLSNPDIELEYDVGFKLSKGGWPSLSCRTSLQSTMSEAYTGNYQVDDDKSSFGPCGQKRLVTEDAEDHVECGQISTQIVGQ